jgi:hypothetical protein
MSELIDLVAYLKSLKGAQDHGESGKRHKKDNHPKPTEGGGHPPRH